MAATFELEISTPEKLVVKEQVSEAQIPATGGYVGVLPGHAPMLSELGIGELNYTVGNEKHSLVISGGVLEVLPEMVRVLTTSAFVRPARRACTMPSRRKTAPFRGEKGQFGVRSRGKAT